MTQDPMIDRKREAFKKYFGSNPKKEDMLGISPFSHTYEELEKIAEEYRQWYTSTKNHSIDVVPKKLFLPYQIHHNLSNENLSRAKLINKLQGKSLADALEDILSIRSIPIPIEDFNGTTIYTSTIYRGKTQVNTGKWFEGKITEFIDSIGDFVEIVSGRSHGKCRYDKDVYLHDEYILSAEISFQVTTNSVIERKSHLDIPSDLTVIMIFGGLGWIERINALERVASKESGYTDCFGPCDEELNRLKQYILSLA